MKISLFLKANKATLKALVNVAKTISQPSYLGFVYLEAKEGKLSAKATNLEVSLQASLVPYEIQEEGQALIDHAFFNKLLASDYDLVEFTIASDHTHGQAKASKVKLSIPILNPETYPELSFLDASEYGALSEEDKLDFIDGLKLCSPSVSTDTARPRLTGISIQQGEQGLDLAATNGHVLSVYKTSVNNSTLKNIALIPYKAIPQLINALQSPAVAIACTGKDFIVHADSLVLCIRLIDEAFPDYKAIIPKSNDVHLQFTDAFKDAFKQASKFLDSDQAIRISGNTEANRYDILVNNAFTYEETEGLQADYSCSFKYDYLANALSTTDIYMHKKSESTPLLATKANGKLIQIVMARRA